MLKLLGAALVLTSSVGYACALIEKQKYHRDVLLSLIRILNLLAGEIRYERITIADALEKLTQKYHGPVGIVICRISNQLREVLCQDLGEAWSSCFREKQRELMLTGEELDIVLEIGKNLGCLDVEAQVEHLRRCRDCLEQKLEESEKDMAEKRKIYCYLAVAVGAMVILILI